MRVVQLTQRFLPALGGVESHVYHLAMGLTVAGISTEVFTTDLQKDTPFRRLNDGSIPLPFRVHRFRAMKFAEVPNGLGIVSPSMAFAALDQDPDVIHAHAYGSFPTFAGAFAGVLGHVPLVVTTHSDAGGNSLSKRLFDRAVPSLTIRRAQRVIALTRGESTYLQRLGVAPEKVRVIPNGVDLTEFTNLPARQPNGQRTNLLFVGRCYPRQKGLEFLLRAIAILRSNLDLGLTVVGEDWGGIAPLQSLSRSLGIEKQVTFTGALPRADVIKHYASADIFVLPSLFEPFGIVLLEAMAAGLPIVASGVGGIVDVVETGRTGLLVPPANPQALAGAIERLASDNTLCRNLSERGRVTAAQHSWQLVIPRILAVYREAILESGAGRAG